MTPKVRDTLSMMSFLAAFFFLNSTTSYLQRLLIILHNEKVQYWLAKSTGTQI